MNLVEERACGLVDGKIVADASGWKLKFCFAGPDLRYNPCFVEVDEDQIDKIIAAYPKAFEKFSMLKDRSPAGADVTHNIDPYFTVRVGRYREGVSIFADKFTCSTERGVLLMVEAFQAVKKRGPELVMLSAELQT